MPAGKLVTLYAITTLVFLALDSVWLSTATALPVAAAFYLFCVMGVVDVAKTLGLGG